VFIQWTSYLISPPPFSSGNGRITPTNVLLSQVYNNETRTKFWGFCTALIFFQDLLYGTDSRLGAITSHGYNFILTRPNSTVPPISTIVIAQSNKAPSGDVVSYTFPITTNFWTLSVQVCIISHSVCCRWILLWFTHLYFGSHSRPVGRGRHLGNGLWWRP
jgi:hypothetical protein